jgi:hypothetical protein
VLDGPRADRALGKSCASWKARASLSSSGSPRSNRAHRLSEFRKEWRIPALTSKVRWDKFEEFRGVGDTGLALVVYLGPIACATGDAVTSANASSECASDGHPFQQRHLGSAAAAPARPRLLQTGAMRPKTTVKTSTVSSGRITDQATPITVCL